MQQKRLTAGLAGQTMPFPDDKEIWLAPTLASPITYQGLKKKFVNVYPSKEFPTLDSFPAEVREVGFCLVENTWSSMKNLCGIGKPAYSQSTCWL